MVRIGTPRAMLSLFQVILVACVISDAGHCIGSVVTVVPSGGHLINTLLLISSILLWVAVLLVGFLLLGTLRSIEVLKWRLEQLEATMPSRIGRSGLKPGKKAPDFTLPSVAGGEVTLADYASRPVLLVFVQTGCSPCHSIVPELNRLVRSGEFQVLAINNSDPEAVQNWAREVGAAFPVLVQEHWNVSKRYEVFATPFAFLIDETGLIVSKGIVNSKQHIGFMLDRRIATDGCPTNDGEPDHQSSTSLVKEFDHD